MRSIGTWRRWCLLAALGTLAALIGPASALAAQRYASPTGTPNPSCTAPGTSPGPCDIVTAVNSAGIGDEVIVIGDQGTYGTPITPLTTGLSPSYSINIHGARGQPRPVIYSNISPALSLDGLEAHDLDIEDAAGTALGMNGGTVNRVIAVGTRGCALHNATLLDSVCEGGTGAGAAGLASVAANASPTPISDNLTIRNSTIYAGSAAGIYLDATGNNGTGTLTMTLKATNAIVRGGSQDILTSASTGGSVTAALDHSNYANVSAGAGTIVTPAGTSGNQTAAPMFAGAAKNDFHELPGSATVDAALTDPANGTNDLDGNIRTMGEGTDIGAYELVVAPGVFPEAASGVGLTTATLNGAISNGDVTGASYFFQYGTTTAYGSQTPTQTMEAVAGAQRVSAAITGLPPGTLIHYRLVAANSAGAGQTTDQTFTTSAPPPGTRITRAKFSSAKRTAKFSFKALGHASGFQCKLKRKHHRERARFRACESPKGYQHLKHGRYVFAVRAVGPGGPDPSPAMKTFTIG